MVINFCHNSGSATTIAMTLIFVVPPQNLTPAAEITEASIARTPTEELAICQNFSFLVPSLLSIVFVNTNERIQFKHSVYRFVIRAFLPHPGLPALKRQIFPPHLNSLSPGCTCYNQT